MIEQIAQVIKDTEVFVITSGAGMGVDSGLPDYRGNTGFWEAYPPYARLGLSFRDCARPSYFKTDPEFAWGFFGHRTNLYRNTIPHEGFHILKSWIEETGSDHFVVTSNIDGQFQKAGYDEDRILEVHGSLHWLQCVRPCCDEIWGNYETFNVDNNTMREYRLPTCACCDEISRPNVLMFEDQEWVSDRKNWQLVRFREFRKRHAGKKMTVIEMGAGANIDTIRRISEELGDKDGATVLRVNPRDPEIKSPHFSIASGALDWLRMMDSRLRE